MSPEELSHVYSSYDIVGDIAIIRLTDVSKKSAKRIADAVMSVHGNVKTVLSQIGAVVGDFRLRKLSYVAGENKAITVHRESGCIFSVDLNACYFSPRLSHERMRAASLVQADETVVNMFAGVGCFSIIIAKHVNTAKVYSIDINSVAIQFMTENVRLNRVYEKVIPMLGDAKRIIENQLGGYADHVLLPLPEKALEYLPHAVSALKPSGGWIHIHTFEHATKTENPAEKAKQKVKEALDGIGAGFEVPRARVVRSIGPNWWQLAIDVNVNRSHLV
jgi:tRNA (guanine37-N1)-methyltransferase